MKRLRYFFAVLILILAFPVWRLLDWANMALPWQTVTLITQLIWAILFIVIPIRLIQPKFNRWMVGSLIIALGTLSWLSGPLTKQTTLEPTLTHCGRTSYAGFFYPAKDLFTQAHQDDLEVRNQVCWVVKMIKVVPSQIPPEELADRLNLMKNKLMKPEFKYRATLPWIAFLLGTYLTGSQLQDSPVLIQNLGFWSNLYTEEISSRNYAWYDRPFAVMSQFEYGFIEKNWENIKLEFYSN